jgi:hypothetical protein
MVSRRSDTSACAAEARGMMWRLKCSKKQARLPSFSFPSPLVCICNKLLTKPKSRALLYTAKNFSRQKMSSPKLGVLMNEPASICSMFHQTVGSVDHRLNRLTFFKKVLGIAETSDQVGTNHMFEPGIVDSNCQRYAGTCYTQKVSRRACAPVVALVQAPSPELMHSA